MAQAEVSTCVSFTGETEDMQPRTTSFTANVETTWSGPFATFYEGGGDCY